MQFLHEKLFIINNNRYLPIYINVVRGDRGNLLFKTLKSNTFILPFRGAQYITINNL